MATYDTKKSDDHFAHIDHLTPSTLISMLFPGRVDCDAELIGGHAYARHRLSRPANCGQIEIAESQINVLFSAIVNLPLICFDGRSHPFRLAFYREDATMNSRAERLADLESSVASVFLGAANKFGSSNHEYTDRSPSGSLGRRSHSAERQRPCLLRRPARAGLPCLTKSGHVLIPATVEGGPMSLLEGLAMGKPVLAPEGVGMVQEFYDTENVRMYPAGDAAALVKLVTKCYDEKIDKTRLVRLRTWDAWALGHHQLFMDLFESTRVKRLAPAVGFRFGMIDELDVPLGVDVEGLESGIDGVARHLFWGRYGEARKELEEVVKGFPCAEKLLETTPDEYGRFYRGERKERG
jgi:hypothetical protein